MDKQQALNAYIELAKNPGRPGSWGALQEAYREIAGRFNAAPGRAFAVSRYDEPGRARAYEVVELRRGSLFFEGGEVYVPAADCRAPGVWED